MEYAFEMNSITKTFPGVLANDDVTIRARKGSVLCIVGENGAGKSTLMNILYGMLPPDSGEILISGKPVSFASSRDAIKNHIGMVFQHFMLIRELSCLENIIIGLEPTKGIVIQYKQARQEIEVLMEKYRMQVPLDTPAGELWVGLQQKLEILKTLYRGAEIMILDEPTAVLTPQETEELFVNIRALAKMGKTILLITHKLDEVMEIADEIVVMRAGRVVAELKPQETSIHDLSVHMVGYEIPAMKERNAVDPQACLSLDHVIYKRKDQSVALDDVSLDVRKGEILGIAGISGNGQSELAQIVAGLAIPDSGTIELNGLDVTRQTREQRIARGVSYIPEDRNTTGVCLPWSIENNCIAGYHHHFTKKLGVIDRRRTAQFARDMIARFSIAAPSIDTTTKSLSGGNCQKVVVARETGFQPEIIVASEPSRGVDIGAINTIHNHMIELRNQGTAILLISSSLDEIFSLSDRIAVMLEGRIVATLDPRITTREEVGLNMSVQKKGVREA